MQRYMISFDDGSMDHIPTEELGIVGEAARGVARDAKAAGVWIFGGGMARQQATVASPDGSVADLPFPETKPVLGGFCLVEVANKQEAMVWAARFAQSLSVQARGP